ncbi:MAG: hypothetical protein ACLS43_06715 [Evtepia gabavorous]
MERKSLGELFSLTSPLCQPGALPQRHGHFPRMAEATQLLYLEEEKPGVP